MTHLAMWEAPAEGPETEWGDQVADAEYLGQESKATQKEPSATTWTDDELARIPSG